MLMIYLFDVKVYFLLQTVLGIAVKILFVRHEQKDCNA